MTAYLLFAAEEIGENGAGPSTTILLLTIFVLAIFVGFEIITKIPPTLHTPLMSGSNAISGITLIGALLSLEVHEWRLCQISWIRRSHPGHHECRRWFPGHTSHAGHVPQEGLIRVDFRLR